MYKIHACIQKFLSDIPSRVSNSLDPDQIRIWVQTVCKGYQQKSLEGKELSSFEDRFSSGVAFVAL